MREQEKRVIAGLTAMVVACGSLMYDSVGFARSNESTEAECPGIIRSYYQAVNEKTFEDILELYDDELSNSVYSFWTDERNRVEKNGIFGVESAEVLDFWKDEVCYSTVQIDGYSDTESYVVKCWMEVDESDKYYQEGNNYFRFTLGEQEGKQKIIDVSVPFTEELLELDKNTEDVVFYANGRNYFIYGDVALEYEISSASAEFYAPPVYQVNIAAPAKIRVKRENGVIEEVDFKLYCKYVTRGEVSVLTRYSAKCASAIAIKMFGIYHSLVHANGADYDVTYQQQAYDPSQGLNEICNKAVDDTWGVFMLDCTGSIFEPCYRSSKDKANGEYCKKNGGLLSQWESDELARTYDETNILRYYYERVEGVDYYNDDMPFGKIIFTERHMHTYNSNTAVDRYCYVCGATPGKKN